MRVFNEQSLVKITREYEDEDDNIDADADIEYWDELDNDDHKNEATRILHPINAAKRREKND